MNDKELRKILQDICIVIYDNVWAEDNKPVSCRTCGNVTPNITKCEAFDTVMKIMTDEFFVEE